MTNLFSAEEEILYQKAVHLLYLALPEPKDKFILAEAVSTIDWLTTAKVLKNSKLNSLLSTTCNCPSILRKVIEIPAEEVLLYTNESDKWVQYVVQYRLMHGV